MTESPELWRDGLAHEGHRHAPRPSAGAGELVGRETDRVPARLLEIERLAPEEQVRLVDDLVAGLRELVGRLLVAVVRQDDARREREGVGAVGPLLAALGDRILAAAQDGFEIELLGLERGQQVLFGRPRDL